MLRTRDDAYSLLRSLGAPTRLLKHVQLVREAADELMQAYGSLGIGFDRTTIELGVAVHDAGKILHPSELNGPGSDHEQAGEALMLANDVQPHIARCCVSHAAWRSPDITFEELSVALADKLWKGKCEAELELRVIDSAANTLGVERWDIFAELDGTFEEIANGGPGRLARSETP
jgi:hypothetical protein